jgi:sec-independent protein translocase protein TatC
MASKLRPSPKPAKAPEPEQEPPQEGHELRMGFFEHLEELRQRLYKAMIALVLGTVIGIVVAPSVMQFLQTPYCQVVSNADECRWQTLDPTESVVVYFRVSLMMGGIIAIPVITYQLMMFILPGLTPKEQRLVFLSLPPITLLFLLGMAFAWFVLMPPALNFLQNFQPDLFRAEWTASGYFGFITALVFWMGVAFETPLVFFVIALLGFVTAGALLRNWRIAVVGAAVAAALITPTIDPVNMALVMGPLLGLYGLSIILVSVGRKLSRVDA